LHQHQALLTVGRR